MRREFFIVHRKTFRRPGAAGGFTLLELVAVVTLIGLFAALAMARLGPSVLGNFGSQANARRLALDLRLAQRRAIALGDSHYIKFTTDSGNLVGYTVFNRTSEQAVDEYKPFEDGLSVTTSHSEPEFTFDGSALAAYQITLSGTSRSWQISVVPLTGAISLTEL